MEKPIKTLEKTTFPKDKSNKNIGRTNKTPKTTFQTFGECRGEGGRRPPKIVFFVFSVILIVFLAFPWTSCLF